MPGIQKIRRVGNRVLERNDALVVRSVRLEEFDAEIDRILDIYRSAWEQNWGHVRVGEKEFRFIAEGFRQILDPDLCFVAEIGGRAAAISITLPDLNQAVKRMKGRLFPFGWWYLLFRSRYIDRLRIFMLGVAEEFQHLPLGAVLYARTFDVGLEKGYRFGEASLILENNDRMRGALEKMGATIDKTYRNYEIDIRTEPHARARDEEGAGS